MLLAMHLEQPFVIDDIERIEVGTFGHSLLLSNLPAPTTLEAAHYSFPFCVALALTAGADALLPIDPRSLGSSAVLTLARRVELVVDPVLDAQFPALTPAAVRVFTNNALRERSVFTAIGDPSLPFTAEVSSTKEQRLLRCSSLGGELATALHAEPFDLPTLINLLQKAVVHS